eukprot:343917_1
MELSLKRMSNVGFRSKYVVFGWIRNVEKLLNSHIPMMISSICTLYYWEDEMFVMVANDVQISPTDNKCIQKNVFTSNFDNSSYGSKEISSISNCNYRWDIKILKANTGHVRIGLSSIQTPNKHFMNTFGINYVYWSCGLLYGRNTEFGPWKKYGIKFGTYDKISILLDLQKKQIRFLVNDIDQGIAYTNVQTSVSLFNGGNRVLIERFLEEK